MSKIVNEARIKNKLIVRIRELLERILAVPAGG